MRLIAITIFILAGFILGWCSSGIYYSSSFWAIRNSIYGDPISYIEEARWSHEEFVKHPEWNNKDTGSPEYHQEWVRRYDTILEVLNAK